MVILKAQLKDLTKQGQSQALGLREILRLTLDFGLYYENFELFQEESKILNVTLSDLI